MVMVAKSDKRRQAFRQALHNLNEALALETPTIYQQEATIKRFELGFELGWKCLKDFLEKQEGLTDIGSPRRVIGAAAQLGLLDEEDWVLLLDVRNQAVHVYDGEQLEELIIHIRRGVPALEALSALLG